MALRVILIVVCVAALVLLYKSKWVLEKFKIAEPTDENALKLKFAALIIAAVSFAVILFV